MTRPRYFLIVLAVAACGRPSNARQSHTAVAADSIHVDSVAVTGVYSDVAYNDESGDVNGTEIVVRRDGDLYTATFQRAEGQPGVLRTVPARVDGRLIRFTIPPDTGIEHRTDGSEVPVQLNPARSFVGSISSWGLTGRVEGEADPLKLPRRARPIMPH